MMRLAMKLDFLQKIMNKYAHLFNFNSSTADIEECSTNPCHVNAMCTDTSGSYTCTCNTGFTGDGVSCQSKILLV